MSSHPAPNRTDQKMEIATDEPWNPIKQDTRKDGALRSLLLLLLLQDRCALMLCECVCVCVCVCVCDQTGT
jgi:hypothetical protein